MSANKTDFFKDNYTDLLQAAMMSKGLRIQDVADKSGYSYEGTRNIVNGKGSYWGVYKVCRALDLDMKSLFKPAE